MEFDQEVLDAIVAGVMRKLRQEIKDELNGKDSLLARIAALEKRIEDQDRRETAKRLRQLEQIKAERARADREKEARRKKHLAAEIARSKARNAGKPTPVVKLNSNAA